MALSVPRSRGFYRGISCITAAVLIIIWFAVTNVGIVSAVFLPTPQAVFAALASLVQQGYKGQPLAVHIGASMYRLLVALFFAVLVAVPLGLAAGRSKLVQAIISPIIEFYRPLPPLAYYSLLVLWFGIGNESKILLLFLSGFAPLLIGIAYASRNVSQLRIQSAQTLGASRARIFFTIIFRECLPSMLTSFRTALGVTYATLVAAEMVASTSGLGWLVLDASKVLRNDIVYAGIILMAAIAIAMNAALELAVRHAEPWRKR